MSDPIRVLIADDHAIVREGLRSLIADEPTLELAGEARSGDEALALSRACRAEVVLLDLMMPGTDGIETIRRLRAQSSGAQVVVLTSFADDAKVQAAVAAGAIGYLLKDVLRGDLVRAIHDAHEGRPALHPEAQRLLMKRVRATQQSLLLGELTAREREVLTLLATGNNNRTIAATLGISEGTVKGYVSGILDTLGVRDRTQAALFALKYRFVDGEIDSRT